MTNLTFGPEAPLWAKFTADAILVLHVLGGGMGIVSGIAALLVPKGGRLHSICGTVFFGSMCIAFGIGACVAPFLDTGQRPNFIAGLFAFYLVVSSWLTIKRREKRIDLSNFVGLFIALGTAIVGAMLIQLAKNDATGTIDGSPPQAFYVFLVLGTIATIDDLIVILRRGISGAARIVRHLWRMCAALFFATGSFFLGQPQVFPEYLRGSMLLFLPVLLPVLLMLFWLLRITLMSWYAGNNRKLSRAIE